MDRARLNIALVGSSLTVIGVIGLLVNDRLHDWVWRVNPVIFECILVFSGVALVIVGLWSTENRFSLKGRLTCVKVIAAVAILLTAAYSFILISRHLEPLREHDGAVVCEIQNLPPSYYTSWDRAWLFVYSGEPLPLEDPHLIVYPFQVAWALNSTALAGREPTVHDFGARYSAGTWFNLTVTDVEGDGAVGDGDCLKVYSQNASFSDGTVYFMEFGVGGPIAPFYVVYGFKFLGGDFDSWVEYGPVEYAM